MMVTKQVQVGFVDKREKLINKPVKGHFDKGWRILQRDTEESLDLTTLEEYSEKDEIKGYVFGSKHIR